MATNEVRRRALQLGHRNTEFFYAIVAFTLFVSCSSNPKSENTSYSIDSTYSEVNNDEGEYLIKRDSYIEQLQETQSKKSGVDDSLLNADRLAISELEGKLKNILKTSRFSNKGEINLNTLLGFLDFGLLDGLSFSKDSLRICYTSKNLFFKYFHKVENQFDRLSPEVFENIFQSAYQFDAQVTNFSFLKIHSTDSIRAYGMVAGLSQISGDFTPQYIYVLVSMGNYVYIAEKELKEPVKKIPRCVSVWDSIISKQSQPVNDNTFNRYCDCYRRDLRNDNQFPAIQKQMELIAAYLEGQ